MKGIIAVVCLFLGTSGAIRLGYDPEACVTKPDPPITRALNATAAIQFDSPGFIPNDIANSVYPPNTVCQWAISSSAVEPMRLTFAYFEVEDAASCAKDHIDVWSGTDDTGLFLGRFCGSQNPVINADANNELFVRFDTDDTVETNGFIARAGQGLDNAGKCSDQGGIITEPSGVVFSSNYPQDYDTNEICRFEFQAPVGQRVQLDFGAMSLAQNCNDDFIEVYEQDPRFVEDQYRIGVWYGSDQLPAVMTSPSNTAFVYFESDENQVSSGFSIQYQHV